MAKLFIFGFSRRSTFYLCLALTRATIQKKTQIARMQRKRSDVHNNFMYTFPWSDVLASFGNEEIVQNFN